MFSFQLVVDPNLPSDCCPRFLPERGLKRIVEEKA